MITNEPAESYNFQKDGMLILLLPFEKRKHHKALKTQSILNKQPTEALLSYLSRQHPIATNRFTKGDTLIGHLPNTPYGNCLSIFPKTYKLNKINIKRVPLLAIADNEMGEASFYSITHHDIQPIHLPAIQSKSFITRFATDKPCIVWIKPGIKIKAVIKGFYLHEVNRNAVVRFPQFSIEQFVQLATRKN